MLIGDRAQLFLHSEEYFPNNDQSAKEDGMITLHTKRVSKNCAYYVFQEKKCFSFLPQIKFFPIVKYSHFILHVLICNNMQRCMVYI